MRRQSPSKRKDIMNYTNIERQQLRLIVAHAAERAGWDADQPIGARLAQWLEAATHVSYAMFGTPDRGCPLTQIGLVNDRLVLDRVPDDDDRIGCEVFMDTFDSLMRKSFGRTARTLIVTP